MSDREADVEPVIDAPSPAELASQVREDVETDAAGWVERAHELSVWLMLALMSYVFGLSHGWEAAATADRLVTPGSFPPVDGWVWLGLTGLVAVAIVTVPLEAYFDKGDEDE